MCITNLEGLLVKILQRNRLMDVYYERRFIRLAYMISGDILEARAQAGSALLTHALSL